MYNYEKNREQVVNDLDRVIKLIHMKADEIPEEEKAQMVKETVEHFNSYVSPGWINYRKCISSETEGNAVLEWEDGGSYFRGLYDNEVFLDAMGGFGIYVAGHSEDLIIDTVKAQLSRQGLHSQELIDPLRGYLAKAMADCTPGDLQQCFFTNCGTEAVEIAMKLARFKSKGKWFISTTHAFHGKTGGSLSLTAKGIYRQPYLPLIQQVQHVEYGNAAAIRTAIENLREVGESIAAVVLEPIQGEAGVIIPPEGYLKEVRAICDELNVLLIIDEIQTGMGRTGFDVPMALRRRGDRSRHHDLRQSFRRRRHAHHRPHLPARDVERGTGGKSLSAGFHHLRRKPCLLRCCHRRSGFPAQE